MRAELERSAARMAALQASNDTLAAELDTVRARLAGVETLNARLASLAAAVEALEAGLGQAGRSSRVARTTE